MTQTDRRPTGRIPIIFASPALLALAPAWRTTVLSLSEMSAAAFFIGGTMFGGVGEPAPWFVLAMVLAGLLVRTAEIESWALFIPGGLVGRVKDAFGRPAALTAAAAVLVERLLFAALAAVVAAHYVVTFGVTVLGRVRLEGPSTADTLATWLAIALVGGLWIRARIAHSHGAGAAVRWIVAPFLVLVTIALWSIVTLVLRAPVLPPIAPPTPALPWLAAWAPPAGAADWLARMPEAIALVLSCLGGLGYALPALGAAEALTRAASDLPQPRLHALRRIARLAGACALIVTAGSAFAFAGLVPDAVKAIWVHAPLAGVAQYLAAPGWLRPIAIAALVAAAALMLGQAAHAGLRDAIGTLQRLAKHGAIAPGFRVQHPRFGTPARVADAVAAAIILILIASAGRVSWLAHAYAVGVVWTQVFRIAALRRLRVKRAAAAAPHAAADVVPSEAPAAVAGPRWTVVLALLACLLTLSGLALLALGDPATWAGTGALLGLALVLTISARRAESITDAEEAETFELLPSTALSLDRVDARPGSVLVAVRHPYSLAHLTAALQAAGDRDVVVMTARLHGHDAEEDEVGGGAHPTAPERLLFSQALAIAERYKRPVRLLIVPAHDVFDALIAAVLRLRASEIYVGESSSLSADAQARLLGEAWERAAKTEPLHVRLVIRHGSGRVASYFLGAHAPTLTAHDLDLIHQLWLDAVKAVGPHVHHHDVVRAALLQMAERLDGPQRAEVIAAITQVAQPAEEVSAIVRQRAFSQLRDVMRNRHASDIATLLTALPVEDQVVAFRLLPRKDAAAAFEYLSHDTQESLIKAMAQEDVASLLNNMAPDDRTMFLEELPATVTRQMLALLTPEERSVAVSLLGYPEDSIGRLMTPHYIAVREHWTVRDVLDFVRTHGRSSETLNVIYVIDESGLLIDDIRIRDFLLNAPDTRVAALMDRRFIALKATDSEDTAVAAFRQYDRVALPVTDTAGMLIGIVTIDDVLDVAEAAATKEIQRIGGSEALDEPYMRIAFGRMIRKRAGWLTVLFLGEMLTATAMGAFEREISKLVVLALFVPLIISSGGNSGSQASTLVIRALALGEVTLADWWRVMRREVSAGLALGAILGLIGFLRITLWSAFSTIYGDHWLLVAITVGLSLVGVVLWGTVVGSLLPLLLRRVGFDPATSSAPFVATLVDVTGLIIYFSVALLVLRVPLQ